jgi:hypothetical protein
MARLANAALTGLVIGVLALVSFALIAIVTSAI